MEFNKTKALPIQYKDVWAIFWNNGETNEWEERDTVEYFNTEDDAIEALISGECQEHDRIWRIHKDNYGVITLRQYRKKVDSVNDNFGCYDSITVDGTIYYCYNWFEYYEVDLTEISILKEEK